MAGCFWGIEHYMKKHFNGAILRSKVGYANGNTKNPTYEQVCSGSTGFAEAVQLEYDPAKVEYKDLVEYHFRIHDPTQLNRQGNDRGSQYRSGIYYHDEQQERDAIEVRDRLQGTKIQGKIVTEIVPFKNWFDAEPYHQAYLENNPGGYCNHRERW